MDEVKVNNEKLVKRFRTLTIGFMGLLVIVIGLFCMYVFKPIVNSATTPGTCLPIEKGGTGCDYMALRNAMGLGNSTSALPIANGGTGATSIEDARVNLSVDYSTSEQPTGQKWIDGKMIYQKTINFGALPNNTLKSVPHGITSMDYLIDIYGVASNNSGLFVEIPKGAPASPTWSIERSASVNSVSIRTGVDYSLYTTTYITLKYTKTN